MWPLFSHKYSRWCSINLNHFDIHSYYRRLWRHKSREQASGKIWNLQENPCLAWVTQKWLTFDSWAVIRAIFWFSAWSVLLRESGELSRELSNINMTWKESGYFTTHEEINQEVTAKWESKSLKRLLLNERLLFGTPLAENNEWTASVLRDEQRSL